MLYDGSMNSQKPTNMTFDQFLEFLTHLDWFYAMSDDHSVYTRGHKACRDALTLAETNGPDWVDAYKAERIKHKINP